MAKEIDVQILGKKITFHLTEDVSTEEFLQIAEYVEKKINKIKNRMNELDPFRLGLLVSMNIAQDLFSLKMENEKMRLVLNKIDTLLTPDKKEEEDLTISLSS